MPGEWPGQSTYLFGPFTGLPLVGPGPFAIRWSVVVCQFGPHVSRIPGNHENSEREGRQLPGGSGPGSPTKKKADGEQGGSSSSAWGEIAQREVLEDRHQMGGRLVAVGGACPIQRVFYERTSQLVRDGQVFSWLGPFQALGPMPTRWFSVLLSLEYVLLNCYAKPSGTLRCGSDSPRERFRVGRRAAIDLRKGNGESNL